MKFIWIKFIAIFFLFTLLVQNVIALDCSPLVPRGGADQETTFEGKLAGKINGLFSKLAGVDVDLEGLYSKVSTDVLKEYPNANHLYIWERLIYLQCELLDKSKLKDEMKFQHFNKLFEMSIKGIPEK
jgi:hypothetical protein